MGHPLAYLGPVALLWEKGILEQGPCCSETNINKNRKKFKGASNIQYDTERKNDEASCGL